MGTAPAIHHLHPSALPRGKVKALSAAANGIIEFIADNGADADAVLRQVGIRENDVRKDTEFLELGSYCELLELAARTTANDNFGLHYGRNFTPDRLGPIGEGLATSPTTGCSLLNLARYFPYHQQNTRTTFRKIGEFWHLEYRILDGFIVGRRQDAELTMGMYLNIVRKVVGFRWSPDEVHFEHPRPECGEEHETIFGAPAYFNMPANALVFRDADLSDRTAGWYQTKMRSLCEALTQLTCDTGKLDLTRRVAGEIRAQLPMGYPHIEIIADTLGMTRWTLQRRLSDDGQIFSNLVDDVRRRLALLYLSQAHLRINDIAGFLGYSELSAFSRACARWFDAPPSKVRTRLCTTEAEAAAWSSRRVN
ncbi:MAG: AraC family transcriptional regulator [Shinella sp.]|nr:AraC family transcriptional regulator [Shinella sp.]